MIEKVALGAVAPVPSLMDEIIAKLSYCIHNLPVHDSTPLH